MHITSFALSLALLASLVTASPLAIAVDAAKRESLPAEGIPIGTVRAVDDGSKGMAGMSKYSDFNGPADSERERAATLHLCAATKCGGPCMVYLFDILRNKCFEAVSFTSAYVQYFGTIPLNFAVYAGEECSRGSTLLSVANNCYNVIGESYFLK